jgi:hypothetical protein
MTRDLIQKIFSIIEVTGVEEGGEVEEEDQEEEQLRSLLKNRGFCICTQNKICGYYIFNIISFIG